MGILSGCSRLIVDAGYRRSNPVHLVSGLGCHGAVRQVGRITRKVLNCSSLQVDLVGCYRDAVSIRVAHGNRIAEDYAAACRTPVCGVPGTASDRQFQLRIPEDCYILAERNSHLDPVPYPVHSIVPGVVCDCDGRNSRSSRVLLRLSRSLRRAALVEHNG